MSDSLERKIIEKRIANLEIEIGAEQGYMDSLYEKYSLRVDRVQIQDCVESINRMYDEILILKQITLNADYERTRG
jgi:hypothetical protein